jgi:hypothetical protein
MKIPDLDTEIHTWRDSVRTMMVAGGGTGCYGERCCGAGKAAGVVASKVSMEQSMKDSTELRVESIMESSPQHEKHV